MDGLRKKILILDHDEQVLINLERSWKTRGSRQRRLGTSRRH